MPRRRTAAELLFQCCQGSPRPIYLVDEERVIEYCNPACAAWVGVSAEELIGQACLYATLEAGGTPAKAAAGLCPPPEALAGWPATGHVSAVGADGQWVAREATFLPLGDSESASAVLTMVSDRNAPAEDSTGVHGEASSAELHLELARLRQQATLRYTPDRLLGSSPAAVRLRAQVALARSAPVNVLIVGPAGSGQQQVARTIHYQGPAEQLAGLVPIACSALDSELLASTLQAVFHKAAARRGEPIGTLLLGDADQLPPAVQGELVRLLASAGALRVVSSTARPLETLAAAGEFRRDLAALLSTLVIELAPLGERLEDLPLLSQALLERENEAGGRQLSGFSPEALDLLAGHGWPGNLDELADVVRQIHAVAPGPEVGPRDLPRQIHLARSAAAWAPRPVEPIKLEAELARVETELVQRALGEAKGNKTRAAELLGLSRPRLYRRLVQLGLASPDDAEGV